MTNKEKLLEQIKTVENLDDIKTVGAFKQIHGVAFNGLEFDFEFLDKVKEAYKERGVTDFPNKFEEYIQEFYATEEKEQKAVAEWFHNFSEQKQKKKTQTTTKNGVIVPAEPPASLNPITASELDKKEIKPIEWLVDYLLPFGLLLLSAPPKNFKSYMALQLCVAICSGGSFLGFKCSKRACLYLDLESTERRPKNRLNQMLGKDTPKPSNLYIATGNREVKRIGSGFETQIKQQLEEHPDIKLIIVDVYQLIALPKKGGANSYEQEYESLKALKKIVDTYNIGIMLITHNRKMKDGSDVFNEVSGSVAMTGSMDATWIIKKDRSSKEATLYITGRDLEQRELKIKFNTDNYQWEYLGTADDLEQQRRQRAYDESNIRITILKLLKLNNGKWQGSSSDLIKNSRLMNCEIYEKAEKVGRFINDNKEFLLWFDNVEVENKRVSNKRFFVFSTVITDTTVIDVITDTTVIDNNIQQELDI